MAANVELARKTVSELAAALPDPKKSCAFGALKSAVMTKPSDVPEATRKRLAWLLGRAS